jgi:predicted enzyme related to lactoylglutathione lyase
MANNRVIHFEIQADDIERAKNFYENALGWKIAQVMEKDKGGMNYWGIETGEGPGINGGLYERSEASEHLYLFDCTINVPDLDEAIEAVKSNGGTITREKSEIPGIGFFAGCKDTEGNRFGLMQATEWKAK